MIFWITPNVPETWKRLLSMRIGTASYLAGSGSSPRMSAATMAAFTWLEPPAQSPLMAAQTGFFPRTLA